jgi:hypothetical protein
MAPVGLLGDALNSPFALAQPVRTQQAAETGAEEHSSSVLHTCYLDKLGFYAILGYLLRF